MSTDSSHWQWTLGNVNFNVVQGDLFKIHVDAIVNSEQTDFNLAWYQSTISGRIRREFGVEVQPQLMEQTQGETMPVGTVLETSGGRYRVIFHAGFHHPQSWLCDTEDENGTEHLSVIRGCVRQILNRSLELNLKSVAFPLIGCGNFGLSDALLASEFFSELFQFSNDAKEPLDVWLTVYQPELMQSVVQAGVQTWLESLPSTSSWDPLRLSIPYLDQFEQQVVRSNHTQWAAWMAVRYAELIVGYMMAVLATHRGASPDELLTRNKPVTFGFLRHTALELAQQTSTEEAWPRFIAELLIADSTQNQILERINQDRNSIAHGRSFRSPEQTREDLTTFLRLELWHELASETAPPRPADLSPWLTRRQSDEVGVLERWSAARGEYVVPTTGERFAT